LQYAWFAHLRHSPSLSLFDRRRGSVFVVDVCDTAVQAGAGGFVASQCFQMSRCSLLEVSSLPQPQRLSTHPRIFPGLRGAVPLGPRGRQRSPRRRARSGGGWISRMAPRTDGLPTGVDPPYGFYRRRWWFRSPCIFLRAGLSAENPPHRSLRMRARRPPGQIQTTRIHGGVWCPWSWHTRTPPLRVEG